MAVIHGQVLIRVQQGNNIVPIPNGGSVTVNSTGVAQPRTLQVTVTYIGSTTLTFPQAPEILGSQDFSITRAPATYTVLAPNQSLTIDLQYLPSSELLAQSEMDFGFLQSAPVPTIPGQTAQPPTPGIIAIGLNGTTPEYSLSYGLVLDGNIVNVSPGCTLVFTDTPVNGSTAATMFVLNRGSGAGQIQSVTVAGDAYSLISMPLLPSVLAAGANFQFQVRYRPRQTGSHFRGWKVLRHQFEWAWHRLVPDVRAADCGRRHPANCPQSGGYCPRRDGWEQIHSLHQDAQLQQSGYHGPQRCDCGNGVSDQ